MIPDLTKLLDYATAARALDCSEPTLRRLVRAHRIGHYRRGRSVRFSSAHIEAYLQSIEQCPHTNSNDAGSSGKSSGGTMPLSNRDVDQLMSEMSQPRKKRSPSSSSSGPRNN